MAPKNLFKIYDPTFQFLFGSFLSILFVKADDKNYTFVVGLPTLDDVKSHLLDPAVFIGVLLFLLFRYLVKDSKKVFTWKESMWVNWHLWNSILIYTMMDGLNGAFSEYGFLPYLHKNGYHMIDRRYRRHLTDKSGGPSGYEASLVRTLNATELLVYSWMSFLTAVSICNEGKWHKTLEVCVLTMAAYGALLFLVPDYMTGCLNMHPMGVSDCMPPMTPFNLFFVYFGVLINWIWLFVPAYMLYVLASEDCKADKKKRN